jgi:hypothetical protein
MNITEYKRLKKQIEEKCKQSVETAQKERLDQQAALEIIWKMSYVPRRKRTKEAVLPQGEASTIDTAPTIAESQPIVYGSLVDTLDESLHLVSPESFTCPDVIKAMEKLSGRTFNYSSVANRLKRLANEKVIEIISKGHGRTPAVYRMKKAQTATDINKKETI